MKQSGGQTAALYLLTGENTYQLRLERQRWLQEFERKYGQENCARVNGSSVSIRELLDEISVLPFLAEKRLIVCDGIPKCTKEEVQALVTHIHPAVLLLFVDAKPDKRLGGTKELLNIATVKEFPALKGASLKAWMTTYVQSMGSVLGTGAAEQLLEYIGEDQDMLAQELTKLSIACAGGTISAEDIERHVIPTDEGVVWKISDMLSTGKKAGALLFAHRLLDRGGDAYGLWAILLNFLKNLVAVYAAADAGQRTAQQIAASTGVHPFAVRSLLGYAQKLPAAPVQSFLGWAVLCDKDIKTGAYRATDEAPQELHALIDRFILRCP